MHILDNLWPWWNPLLSIFFGTLILEDAALAYSIAVVKMSQYPAAVVVLVCGLGISLGDLLLYAMGRFSGHISAYSWIQKLKSKAQDISLKHSRSFGLWIVLSRAVPGTRLPTYFAAGFSRYSFFKFVLLTVTSVFIWVSMIVYSSYLLPDLSGRSWIWIVVVGFILIQLLSQAFSVLINSDRRMKFILSVRKMQHFEFWPSWLFYLPVIPIYLYLSLKHRSPFMPFYVNPGIRNGGLVGESKWDFLKYFSSGENQTKSNNENLKTEIIKLFQDEKKISWDQFLKRFADSGLSYPFILKPDIGQRGFAVRIIRSPEQHKDYYQEAQFDLIQQQLSPYAKEAGVFYIRYPWEKSGFIFSITAKEFPIIVGDGIRSVSQLILQNPRASLIYSVYFQRHQDRLNQILQNGERLVLTECGNHCQGTIFLNGKYLMSPELESRLDQLAKKIPDFYFGRFDIRYQDDDSFRKGRNFHIIEINGAGSEATHIWDRQTTLWQAYVTLYRQWNHAFKIGSWIVRNQKSKISFSFKSFASDVLKLAFRRTNLERSS